MLSPQPSLKVPFVPDESFLPKVVSDPQFLDFLWFHKPFCALSDYDLQVEDMQEL